MEKQGMITADPASSSGTAVQELLQAINALRAEVRETLAPPPPEDLPELGVLRGQLHELRESIERTKREIAAVRHPDARNDRLTTAAMELDAIVGATEEATHRILNATEEVEDLVAELKERIGDVAAIERLDGILNHTTQIFEACNFQDISGQRTGKVITTIRYLEDRIATMIDIWGAEEFEEVPAEEEVKDADAALLEGPQLKGEGVSQSDIDALFD
jgi:chemotaxis protein CheZ